VETEEGEKKYSEKDLERILKRFKMDYKSQKFPLGFMVLLVIGVTLLLIYLYVLPILEIADKGREVAEEMADWEILSDEYITIESGGSYKITIEHVSKGDDINIFFDVETNNALLDSDSGMVDYKFRFSNTIISQEDNSEGDDILYKAEQNGDYNMEFTNADKDIGILPSSQTSDSLHVIIQYRSEEGSSSTPQAVEDLGFQGICLIPVILFLIIGSLGVGIWVFKKMTIAKENI
jgi:hypothetical protein